MAHFAKVVNDIVEQVIVAEQDVIDSGIFGEGWIQTSYNTYGGQHPEGRPLRKNYAGVGYTYDSTRDAFIPPKPYASWTLNEVTCLWDAPTPKPTDGQLYYWDEATLNWIAYEELELSTEADTLSSNGADTIVSGADTVIDLNINGADSIVNGADSIPGGV